MKGQILAMVAILFVNVGCRDNSSRYCHEGFLPTNQEAVLQLVNELKEKMQITPLVWVRIITGDEEEAMYANAHISRGREGAFYICISKVLIQDFAPLELKGLLAHELGHWKAFHLEFTWQRSYYEGLADNWAVRAVGRKNWEDTIRHLFEIQAKREVEIKVRRRIERLDRVLGKQ